MNISVDPFALQAFATAMALHVLKTLFIAIRSVALRKQGGLAFPVCAEDHNTVYKGREIVAEPNEVLLRYQNMHRNDLENLLLFACIGLVNLLTGGGVVSGWIFYGFVLMRFVHTICYAAKLQPWRTVSWVVGSMLPLVALSCLTIWQVWLRQLLG